MLERALENKVGIR